MYFSFPYMYHMPCSSRLPRFDRMNNICSVLQMMKLITHFSAATPVIPIWLTEIWTANLWADKLEVKVMQFTV